MAYAVSFAGMTCPARSRLSQKGANLRVMHRIFLRTGFAAAAFLALVGCDQLSAVGLGPRPAVSAPVNEPAPQAVADFRPLAGTIYADFIGGEGARYSPEQLGFNAADRERLRRTMAAPVVGRLEQGGGAEALVFRGCAAGGCQDGASVIAIDTSTGAVFAALRDEHGSEVLAPNDRVEALLRLNSPTRAWDDPAAMQTASTETANP